MNQFIKSTDKITPNLSPNIKISIMMLYRDETYSKPFK